MKSSMGLVISNSMLSVSCLPPPRWTEGSGAALMTAKGWESGTRPSRRTALDGPHSPGAQSGRGRLGWNKQIREKDDGRIAYSVNI